LATAAVGDFVSSLAPLSAGANLLNAAERASLDGINTILYPRRSGAINPAAAWIGEGSPIPVAQFVLSNVQLGPTRKLAVDVVMTRETAEHGSGEAAFTALLREDASAKLDASLFSNTAATTAQPAGILDGVSPLSAATAGADAMDTDLSALAAAIGTATAGLAFVAHPAQAYAIKLLRRGSTFPADVPVWPTLGVTEGTVIALDPRAFVSAFGPEPEITVPRDATVHLDDATPLPISTAGSPNTVAAPVRSLFQTDCIGVRMLLRATWAWRQAGAVAWMQNTNW
jgi:hypothetical protein